MIRNAILPAAAITLAALGATTLGAQETEAPKSCNNTVVHQFVGQPATSETGAAIMKASGAEIFQWVFENSPVTSDFRPNRVRVVYNREMVITRVSCG